MNNQDYCKLPLLILCGGQGTRLSPVTMNRIPKNLVPLNQSGNSFLKFQIDYFRKSGFKNLYFLVSVLGDQIEAAVNDLHLDVTPKFFYEDAPLGTGGAIQQALPSIASDFFITYGDVFLPLDFSKLFATISQIPSLGSCMVGTDFFKDKTIENENVKIEGLKITKYSKHEPKGTMDLVDAGLSFIRRSSLLNFIEENHIPEKSIWSFEEKFFAHLIEEGQLYCHKIHHRSYDIGTPERLDIFKSKLKEMSIT